MKTLYEYYSLKGSKISGKVILKHAQSLINRVKSGKLKYANPNEVIINNNGTIKIEHSNKIDYYYAEPEKIIDDKKLNNNSGYFTVGLLLYFMLCGCSYYEDKNIKLVDLPQLREQRDCLIPYENVEKDPDRDKVRKCIESLTAWDESKRCNVTNILKQQTGNHEVTINLLYNLSKIFSFKIRTQKDAQILEKGRNIKIGDSTFVITQNVDINFNSNICSYDLEVEKLFVPLTDRNTSKIVLYTIENTTGGAKLFDLEEDKRVKAYRMTAKDIRRMIFRLAYYDKDTKKAIDSKDFIPKKIAISNAIPSKRDLVIKFTLTDTGSQADLKIDLFDCDNNFIKSECLSAKYGN